jgi:hypothetical protein
MRILLAALCAALLVPASAAVAMPSLDSVRVVDGGAGARLEISASGDSNGVSVARADGTGATAESACAAGVDSQPAAGPFSLPVPGDPSGDVRVSVTSSGCGAGDGAPSSAVRSFALAIPVPGGSVALPPVPLRAVAARACGDTALAIAAKTIGRVRRAIVCLVNRERRAAGLRRVQRDRRLQRAATAHVADMQRQHYFSHRGPGEPDLLARLARVRFPAAMAGENLATGSGSGSLSTARAVVDAWMHSPGHRANILNGGFRRVGIGIVPAATESAEPGETVAAEFGTRIRRR